MPVGGWRIVAGVVAEERDRIVFARPESPEIELKHVLPLVAAT
jgi:hypothetical protein